MIKFLNISCIGLQSDATIGRSEVAWICKPGLFGPEFQFIKPQVYRGSTSNCSFR